MRILSTVQSTTTIFFLTVFLTITNYQTDTITIMSTSIGQKIPIITRLSSKIIRILGCNPGPMTLQGTNTYLLGTGKQRILIDTGDINVPEYINNLQDVLKKENAFINDIILTHWHHDHVGGVKDVVKLTNNNHFNVWKYPRSDSVDECPEIPQNISISKLYDGQTFKIDDNDNLIVKIHHTPGHTTDHVILTIFNDNSRILFSGDCILGEGTAVFEDLYDYMRSLQKILDLRPSVIYPGHGNIIENPISKIQYYIDHRNQREKQILELLKTNINKKLDEMDIVKVIYKETPENLWNAAAYNVNHHLKKLTKEHKISEIVGDDGSIKWMCTNINSSL